MSIRKIVTAVTAAVVLAPAAFAATTPAPAPTPAAQCESLQKEFNSTATTKSTSPNIDKARKAAAEGEKLCKEGKPAEGAKKLEHALKELGVKVK